MLRELWGPHTVDRFSCHYNAKLSRFNSRSFQLGANGVNAFSFDWLTKTIGYVRPSVLVLK